MTDTTTTPASDTPRCDEDEVFWGSRGPEVGYITSELGREMERELTASNTALAEARERVKELERDKVRLDWLDKCHGSFTFHCGTVYGSSSFGLVALKARNAIDDCMRD